MTPAERQDIKTLNKSRVRRVAKGSASVPADVNKLTKQFDMMSKMTQQMAGMGVGGKMKAMRDLSKVDPNLMPGLKGMPGLGGKGSTKTQSVKKQYKQRKKKRK